MSYFRKLRKIKHVRRLYDVAVVCFEVNMWTGAWWRFVSPRCHVVMQGWLLPPYWETH